MLKVKRFMNDSTHKLMDHEGVGVMGFNASYNNISVIMLDSFIGGGNQSTRRKPQINHIIT